jgi:hypothetical protein
MVWHFYIGLILLICPWATTTSFLINYPIALATSQSDNCEFLFHKLKKFFKVPYSFDWVLLRWMKLLNVIYVCAKSLAYLFNNFKSLLVLKLILSSSYNLLALSFLLFSFYSASILLFSSKTFLSSSNYFCRKSSASFWILSCSAFFANIYARLASYNSCSSFAYFSRRS